jgi:hypothetical protein
MAENNRLACPLMPADERSGFTPNPSLERLFLVRPPYGRRAFFLDAVIDAETPSLRARRLRVRLQRIHDDGAS